VKARSVSGLIESGVAPADHLRRLLLRLLLGSRPIAFVLTRKDRRLATATTLHAAVAFALAVYFPVLLFVLGPISFGALHVAADVRHLVLRRRLAAWWQTSVLAGCAALLGLHALEHLGVLQPSPRLESMLVMSWAAAGALAGATRSGAWLRAAAAIGLAALFGGLSIHWPNIWRIAFLHAHNLIALAVLPLFFRSRRLAMLVPLAFILGGAGLLASGALCRVSLASAGVSQFGLHVFQVSDWIAPFRRADLAVGLTSAFVFLQAVHYGIWLNVIPQGEVRGQGTLTFRMSVRSLFADLGVVGVTLTLLTVVAIAVGACIAVTQTLAAYLSLAMFHGYLELVMIAYLWVARGPADVRGARQVSIAA
jgi:hypothetical protein